MAATSKIKGDKALRKNLSKLERSLAPRAMANSLNRTGTKTRQQVVRDARAGGSKLKARELRALVRVAERAKAPNRLTARVARDAPAERRTRRTVPTSAPFRVARFGNKRFARALQEPPGYRGRGRTRGRPATSPENLPLVPLEPRSSSTRRILQRTLVAAARAQMRTFLPGEFRRQLAKQVAKIQARGRA